MFFWKLFMFNNSRKAQQKRITLSSVFSSLENTTTILLKQHLFFRDMKNQPWIKKQKLADEFEVIVARHLDTYKDFMLDEGCYVLIRIYRDTKEIGVGICNYNHEILREFRGKRAEDLYTAIFDYSAKQNKNWFKKLEHAAYLGKELQKAEFCLALGTEYVQE